jgi:hypothetical protein
LVAAGSDFASADGGNGGSGGGSKQVQGNEKNGEI